MRILSISRCVLSCFLVTLLVLVSFCYGGDQTVEVVGVGECADCKQSNIDTSHAFSGLQVTVDCKTTKGHFQTIGVGELDKEGKFNVNLPKEMVEDGKLKEECYAQLHSASSAPCPAHNGIESSKIIFQSKSDQKHTFSTTGKLTFSTPVCTSAFLWPHYKKKYLNHPWKKSLPPKPVYKFTPKPTYTLPPKPVYTLPPKPAYKYTPKPVYTLPPKPVYTLPPKPVYTKPPIYKKPCPPLAKLPPKYFHHPKLKFPPIPPYHP